MQACEVAHARQSMRASLHSLNRNIVLEDSEKTNYIHYEKVLFITAKRYDVVFL